MKTQTLKCVFFYLIYISVEVIEEKKKRFWGKKGHKQDGNSYSHTADLKTLSHTDTLQEAEMKHYKYSRLGLQGLMSTAKASFYRSQTSRSIILVTVII